MTSSPASPWGLKNRRILVSGAAGGIGAAVVSALLQDGAWVIASDLNAERLINRWEAHQSNPLLTLAPLDLTDGDAVDQLIEQVEVEQGPIDGGAAIAGVLHTGLLVDTTNADWDRLISVNAGGVFHLHRALARRMLLRQRGSLVTVASNAGSSARHGLAAYGASKAAASMLTRALALELAPQGIRCNVVAPGSTDTPMLRSMYQDDYGEQQVILGSPSAFRTGIPLGRIADPSDIADAVLFFLSDRSRQITMAELVVDGGATQRG